MRLRSPFRPTRSRVPSLRRSTRSPCRSVPVLLLALALCSHLRFRSLTEGLKRRPGPSEELDEELDVIQTNRLNDRGHGAQEEYDEVKHEGCEESNENQEDKGHHIPGIECWENHGLEHDDVERERHGRLRDADRREARIGDDVRQETEEFHDVERTLRPYKEAHNPEDRRPIEQLEANAGERRMVERDPERLPEQEDAEEEGPESAPNERDEEVLPEVPRTVFPPSKQPEAIDPPDEPVAGVAHHEAEEDRECEREDKGRVDLAVVRRRKELHEHLEWSEGFRIPEQDGRIRLRGRRFRVFGAMILFEFGDEQPREASEPALEFLEGFRRDPAFDDERVIRHGESERGFRLLDRHFEVSLRGGEEPGVPLS